MYGCLVLWLYGVLVLLFCGCVVLYFLWLYGFVVCVWFYSCMILWFLCFKNTKCPFHVFRNILIPYPRFSRFYLTDLHHFAAPVFSNVDTFWWGSTILKCPKIIFLKHVLFFYGLCLGILVSPKIHIVGFGAWQRVQKVRNHRNEGFGVLP